jgi:hypothetical protein
MLVMSGIIGAGIFMNPYLVAQQVHTPGLILGAVSVTLDFAERPKQWVADSRG